MPTSDRNARGQSSFSSLRCLCCSFCSGLFPSSSKSSFPIHPDNQATTCFDVSNIMNSTYQPYMERQYTPQVHLRVMDTRTSLYGASINYSVNSSCDDCTYMESFVSYPVCKRKFLWTHDPHTINLYLHVDFCERVTYTKLLTSVGLAQAHPNDASL